MTNILEAILPELQKIAKQTSVKVEIIHIGKGTDEKLIIRRKVEEAVNNKPWLVLTDQKILIYCDADSANKNEEEHATETELRLLKFGIKITKLDWSDPDLITKLTHLIETIGQ